MADPSSIETTSKSSEKPLVFSRMAKGHSSVKTSIFVNGLFYNLDKLSDIPKEYMTDEVLRAIIRRECMTYSIQS